MIKTIKEWAGVVALVAIILTWAIPSPSLFGAVVNGGNVTNFDAVDTTAGYFVDTSEVISGTGNVTAPITSTTGTFSSTLSVSGALTSSSATSTFATTTVGTTTPGLLAGFSKLIMDGVGTTTFSLQSSTVSKGTCFNLEADDGTLVKAYIHTTSWVIAAGRCDQ